MPALDRPTDLQFAPEGWIGDRLGASEANWLIPAPATNPGMVEMFAHRDDLTFVNAPGDKRFPESWAGEFAGKYLISAVQSLRLTGNASLKGVLTQFVNNLLQTQAPDGSLGMPLPWDLWGQYHVMLGLLRWYEYTGDVKALTACQGAANRLCAKYTKGSIAAANYADAEKNQAVAHVLALLYEQAPGKESVKGYLDLVHGIEEEWKEPAGGDFIEHALAGNEFYTGRRPRWESLHDVQAIAELYFVTGQTDYRKAFEQIWRSIRSHDRHVTGGFTAGELATGNAYDGRYIETCGTVAWMALTIDMIRMTADPSAADELELSLFNAVLGAQSPDGRFWTYHTPMGGIPIEGVALPAALLALSVPCLLRS